MWFFNQIRGFPPANHDATTSTKRPKRRLLLLFFLIVNYCNLLGVLKKIRSG
jgi:hypothetical protein